MHSVSTIMHKARELSKPEARDKRRRRIAELVREKRIKSQFELQDLLAAEGIDVNQATLSRDVRDMRLLKGREGYEVPDDVAAIEADQSIALQQVVHRFLTLASTAQNLVVLRTPAGGAGNDRRRRHRARDLQGPGRRPAHRARAARVAREEAALSAAPEIAR
jgi:transcriptional regulator of arginine metabolism